MIGHWSDCAIHNEPASPAGECDCGTIVYLEAYSPYDMDEETTKRMESEPTYALETDQGRFYFLAKGE